MSSVSPPSYKANVFKIVPNWRLITTNEVTTNTVQSHSKLPTGKLKSGQDAAASRGACLCAAYRLLLLHRQ